MNGRDANMNWHLASLTAGEDKKMFDISVNHIAPLTFARMDNYGVCKDSGKDQGRCNIPRKITGCFKRLYGY